MLSLARSLVRGVLWAAAVIAAAGCQSVGFYAQAVSGQLSIMHRRQPVDELLEELAREPDVPQQRLIGQLQLSRDILAFAEHQLGLEVGKRYRTFVALDEEYVLWNVFAAPELKLVPRNWCYPLVGCAPYRGYFHRQRASDYARKLRKRDFETYVGGVAAYSTLGWFADPLLSSFVYWPERNLAELLFHELAHTQVWVESDVAFNEAFATFVGGQAASEFSRSRASQTSAEQSSAWPGVLALLLSLRSELKTLYALDIPESYKRELKHQAYAWARACYQEDRENLGAGRFDSTMEQVNNAYLVSLTTYQDAVPAFSAMFDTHGADWSRFFAAVAALGELEPAERAERVAELREQHEAHSSNDQGAQQVQCEPFSGHGLDGKTPSTEDDDVGRGGHG